MSNKGKPLSDINLLKLKIQALGMTAQLSVLTMWKLWLITATVTTVVLAGLFHLNAPVAFLGSFVGSIILCLVPVPLKTIWRSNLAMLLQQHGQWELADDMGFGDISAHLQDILEGRTPKVPPSELEIGLAQAQLTFIRRGEQRKALKVAQYLYNNQSGDSNDIYDASTLGSILIGVGRYQEGIALLKANCKSLDSEDRVYSPSKVTNLLTLIHTSLELRKFDDAQDYISELKETIDCSPSQQSTDQVDQLVRTLAVKSDIDRAFYFMYLGRFIQETGSVGDAELALQAARDIMTNEDLQKQISLLYPEILLALGYLELSRQDCPQAERWASEALDYYNSQTRFKGSEYHNARALLVYAQWKQGRGERAISELEDVRQQLQSELEENHPFIAACLVQLGDCYIAEGKTDAAIDALNKALQIRQAIFSPDDVQIAEVAELINTISVAV
jgi:hypothetical protein